MVVLQLPWALPVVRRNTLTLSLTMQQLLQGRAVTRDSQKFTENFLTSLSFIANVLGSNILPPAMFMGWERERERESDERLKL